MSVIWTSKKLIHAAGAWAQQTRKLRAVGSKVCRRLQNWQLAAAIDAWRGYVTQQQWATALVARCLTRMRLTVVASAMCTWSEWSTTRVRGRQVMRKVVMHMQQMILVPTTELAKQLQSCIKAVLAPSWAGPGWHGFCGSQGGQ